MQQLSTKTAREGANGTSATERSPQQDGQGRSAAPPEVALDAGLADLQDQRPEAVAQRELQEALNTMDSMDREVLALRHFEHLDNGEAAEVLEISPSGASSRYLRALKRLRQILDNIPGFFAD